jgi:hypothetical protein
MIQLELITYAQILSIYTYKPFPEMLYLQNNFNGPDCYFESFIILHSIGAR